LIVGQPQLHHVARFHSKREGEADPAIYISGMSSERYDICGEPAYCSDDEVFYPLSFDADILEEAVSCEPGIENNQDIVQNHIESHKQSYCPSPSTADSPTRNHGLYQPHDLRQHNVVLGTLFGEFHENTLKIRVVPFFPFDHSEYPSNPLGWDKFENKSAAVSAINKALRTLHENDSLYIRLATQTATRIKTRIQRGETVGPAFMQFLNSMIVDYQLNTFEVDGKHCEVSFREGTRKPPSAPSGTATATLIEEGGPRIAPLSSRLVLKYNDWPAARTLISKGTQNITLPDNVPSCVIGSVPFWTAGQRAESSAE